MNNIFQKGTIAITTLLVITLGCLVSNFVYSEEIISTGMLGVCLLLLLSQLKKENLKL